MTRPSKLTVLAAVIAAVADTSAISAQAARHKRAHAESYSFPTYAVTHPGKSPQKSTVPGSAAQGDSR
jgi:uncharacterized membrane protein